MLCRRQLFENFDFWRLLSLVILQFTGIGIFFFYSPRVKVIDLQVTLLRALETHTSSQRQWKGVLPRVQITGYMSVCFSSFSLTQCV